MKNKDEKHFRLSYRSLIQDFSLSKKPRTNLTALDCKTVPLIRQMVLDRDKR